MFNLSQLNDRYSAIKGGFTLNKSETSPSSGNTEQSSTGIAPRQPFRIKIRPAIASTTRARENPVSPRVTIEDEPIEDVRVETGTESVRGGETPKNATNDIPRNIKPTWTPNLTPRNATGNTSPKPESASSETWGDNATDNGTTIGKHRCFAITDWVYDMAFWDAFWEKEKPYYMVMGHEVCPDTGKNHLQGFIQFKSQRSLTATEKKVRYPDPITGKSIRWITPMRKGKTPLANEIYCKEDGKFKEWGHPPSKSEQGARTDLYSIAEDIMEGKVKTLTQVARTNPMAIYQYGKGFKNLLELQLAERKRTWKTEVIAFWGPTGTGKSYHALEAPGQEDVEIVFADAGFINGYSGEERVCFEEFDPKMMSRAIFLQITDKHRCKVNVKTSHSNWCPRVIYFTSNSNPAFWYMGTNGKPDEAILRRFDKIIELKTMHQSVIDTLKSHQFEGSVRSPDQEVPPVIEENGGTTHRTYVAQDQGPLPNKAHPLLNMNLGNANIGAGSSWL